MNHADKLAAALRAVLDHVGTSDFADAVLHADVLLAEHDERTFASDCHDLADRARVIVQRNELAPSGQLHFLRMLEASAHAVGDNAESAPALYLEP